MIYCLHPSCEKPLNPYGTNFCQSCGTKLVSVLGNCYRIIQPLGGGGFGRTYLAEDQDKLKEHCVVKQLAPQVLGTKALRKATELFQEEARRLQQLGEHPQIPTLYAYFGQDNYLYLVHNVSAVAFSPDGKTIATGSDDKTIKMWNLHTGEELDTLKGHSGEVYAVAFSPDGKTLLSASADKTIKIWQLP